MRRHEISSFSLGRLMGYKSFLMALIATALSAGTQRAQASIITGGISFNGNVTAYSDNSGSGPLATSLAAAESLGFGPSVVSDGANGSFSVIAANTPVTMHSPLLINPAVSIPASTPLWQVTVGPTTYSFTPTTPLVEVFVSANALILTDTGTFSDGTPADNNTNASWVGTFTTSGSTYSWNASSSAAAVPEPASLTGLGLVTLGGMGMRRMKRKAA